MTVAGERATDSQDAANFSQRVRANQQQLRAALKPRYDFIVCGAGSAGSVVARRLAENLDASVLLVEAGGCDTVPAVTEASQWPTNLGSKRDWAFRAAPNPRINGRSVAMPMGKVLGGGSAVNVMVWARGHRLDWDFFAAEAADPAWGYDAVLEIYRRIEDWHGPADPLHRGTGGPVFVQPAPEPSPLAPATLEAARSIGIPTYENQNGRMMEGPGGAAITDVRLRNGKRQSVFRSYTYPVMDRPNLTVLTDALVTRVSLDANRATGVEISYHGSTLAIGADSEVVLSLGTMHTPKVLMYSGIGDEAELRGSGIPVRQHLPGVGRNLHDHVALYCVWQDRTPLPPQNNMAESTVYWTVSSSDAPDVFICQVEAPLGTDETIARFGLPDAGWTMVAGVAHPKSRGRVRLTGPNPNNPICIDTNTFGDPDDFKAANCAVQLSRAIANAPALAPFVSREIMPGNLKGCERDQFVRDAATSYWHPCGTAKMGRTRDAVVDAALRVYGIENLRIADASIMPRITSGNTMAPCVIIGERAAELLIADHSR
ncbi:GMC family oxidoreductase [Mycobacterium montefiorense]|uniref:Choline dehydrogenase n=1 Tax=Mycobacterium montefiorense TaxID=154654 RepID=A0AA37PN11_9MYCO|nr:GMC family oxidoreductase N-terminal domain-containing protein [Mycobacterium montefiorense]GBG37713.1 choline dehydrogenase [Mycobacterium montefiorense]GKU34851.1 choline dehydrogenase [Mycobacterium montefiorense]GKU40864.1 choline dehydrogenase [Mycobacterium montefiorense]GKU46972.1 choline dehydrogenase [Mycobacterium montefiorense]GKU49092.1 choline dehydrogenase [Mycobacterium montefiorense]